MEEWSMALQLREEINKNERITGPNPSEAILKQVILPVGNHEQCKVVELVLSDYLHFFLKGHNEFAFHPVANAINVLQDCIYKSVNTSLFLKSFVATHVV